MGGGETDMNGIQVPELCEPEYITSEKIPNLSGLPRAAEVMPRPVVSSETIPPREKAEERKGGRWAIRESAFTFFCLLDSGFPV